MKRTARRSATSLSAPPNFQYALAFQQFGEKLFYGRDGIRTKLSAARDSGFLGKQRQLTILQLTSLPLTAVMF